MVKIAILGYGVVGSGIMQVLDWNRERIALKAGCEIGVKHVLDIRDFPGDPIEKILTRDVDEILSDPEIKIVAEVIGGVEPAHTFVKKALLAGKHVCTSNKELVVNHGAELLSIARDRELNFLFEASVGGGIPIVRPMNLALTTDEIVGVAGILNGTSNYILTQMEDSGRTFGDALAEAQSLGYAEKNPEADVEGYDACRKLAILLSLATGRQVNYKEIHTEGITSLDAADFAFAREFGYHIKLLVDGRVFAERVEAVTAPMLVSKSHPLANVADVFNGVLVQAKVTDDVMFFGRGAGKLPTAGAVVSDIVDIAKHLGRHIMHVWTSERMPVADAESCVKRRMARLEYNDLQRAADMIRVVFGASEYTELPGYPGQLAFIAPCEAERDFNRKYAGLSTSPAVAKTFPALRVYEPISLRNEEFK